MLDKDDSRLVSCWCLYGTQNRLLIGPFRTREVWFEFLARWKWVIVDRLDSVLFLLHCNKCCIYPFCKLFQTVLCLMFSPRKSVLKFQYDSTISNDKHRFTIAFYTAKFRFLTSTLILLVVLKNLDINSAVHINIAYLRHLATFSLHLKCFDPVYISEQQ